MILVLLLLSLSLFVIKRVIFFFVARTDFSDYMASMASMIILTSIILRLSRKAEIDFIKEMFHVTRIVLENQLFTCKVNIINRRINNGFIFNNYVVIGEYDIEKTNTREIKYKNTYKIGKKIKGFDQLQVGDYVVHTYHGIGRYEGVISLTKNGVVKDYLQITYADNDKIYVPVEKISTIFKKRVEK